MPRPQTAKPSAVAKAGKPKNGTKREQREASIDAILVSALKLFVHKGYRSTTGEEIASACSLTKGAIYFYFPNKAAVLFTLLDEIEDLMINRMIERIGQAGPAPQDKLVALINFQSQAGLDNAEKILLFILMLLEFNGAGDSVEERVRTIYRRYYTTIESLIAEGQKSGAFRDDIDVRSMAGIVMAVNNGTMMEWYCRSDGHKGRELARAGREITLAGVLKPQP